MRTAQIQRNTTETRITLQLNLDGTGSSDRDTGCGCVDHLLPPLSRHGRFDLTIRCQGDTQVDYHHTTEDIGIALGTAFSQALGDKRGICRYGDTLLPMDEALILSAADLSGRGYLGFDLSIPTQKVGEFDTELVAEFWLGFVRQAQCTLHIKELSGTNSHHIIEGAFKSVARSLKKAVLIDPVYAGEIPSTKGVL